jgi:hypothetical protein
MDGPEPPHHHTAHTGHRWLDIVLGLSAMFVSAVSLIVAIGHGRTMERMADANARMVQANSWPFLEFVTHNADEHGNGDVRLVITNQGIGPARIQTLELWYRGQAIASSGQLIKMCCQANPDERAALAKTIWSMGATAPSILRPGDHTDFLAAAQTKGNLALWEKFNQERDKITVRMCYCSVFDECWTGSGQTTQADRVPGCPVPAVPFRVTDWKDLESSALAERVPRGLDKTLRPPAR